VNTAFWGVTSYTGTNISEEYAVSETMVSSQKKTNLTIIKIYKTTDLPTGHVVAWWLRHCTTSQKVMGSKPDELNEFIQFT
jgi:hypothetical protein